MWIPIHFLWIGSCCSFQRGSWFSIFLNANSDPDPAYTNLYKITKWTVEKDKNDCLKVRNHGAGPNLLNLKNKITFTTNFLAFFLFLPPNFSSWIRIPILMCMWIREGERMQILAYLDPKLCSICTKGMKSLQIFLCCRFGHIWGHQPCSGHWRQSCSECLVCDSNSGCCTWWACHQEMRLDLKM